MRIGTSTSCDSRKLRCTNAERAAGTSGPQTPHRALIPEGFRAFAAVAFSISSRRSSELQNGACRHGKQSATIPERQPPIVTNMRTRRRAHQDNRHPHDEVRASTGSQSAETVEVKPPRIVATVFASIKATWSINRPAKHSQAGMARALHIRPPIGLLSTVAGARVITCRAPVKSGALSTGDPAPSDPETAGRALQSTLYSSHNKAWAIQTD